MKKPISLLARQSPCFFLCYFNKVIAIKPFSITWIYNLFAILVVIMLFGLPSFSYAYVAFVGNSVVDFRWNHYLSEPVSYYYISRDDQQISGNLTPDHQNMLFYRDKGLNKGTTYVYELCYKMESGQKYCTNSQQVTTGEVAGTLYQSLRWAIGAYDLSSHIHLYEDVILNIDSGVTVKPATDSKKTIFGSVDDGLSPAGSIQIDGAMLERIELVFYSADDNYIKNSILGKMIFEDPDAGVNITLKDQAKLVISNNKVHNCAFNIKDSSQAQVSKNEFHDCQFSVAGSLTDPPPILRFTNNTLSASEDFPWPGGTVLGIHAADATITSNKFTGPQSESRNIVGIWLTKPMTSILSNNIISGFYYGLAISGCSADNIENASCEFDVSLTVNTITNNTTGVMLWDQGATATVNNNCIAENSTYGLNPEIATQTDATNNWWGSDSGPTLYDNPAGSGDTIYANAYGVIYEPWLDKPNCQENITTPPSNNIAPVISMSPSEDYTFQASILEKKGFILSIHDDDGIQTNEDWNIDWNKFRVYVDEINVTGEFLTILAERKLLVFTLEEKEIKLLIKPDPEKFMAEDNLFNITKNGLHTIAFGICDTGGLCGQSTYKLYFGPFALLRGPVNVTLNKSKTGISELESIIHIGNSGYAVQFNMYLVINNGSKYISYNDVNNDISREFIWHEKILPYIYDTPFLATGSIYKHNLYSNYPEILSLNDVGPSAIFYVGLLDKSTGEFSLDYEEFSVK